MANEVMSWAALIRISIFYFKSYKDTLSLFSGPRAN
jgi:hypothetical protein